MKKPLSLGLVCLLRAVGLVTACGENTPVSINSVPTGSAGTGDPANSLPILFVHGNGDSSSLWITTLWRFESNGYPREKLFTIDFPNPKARDNDSKEQANRSGTAEQLTQLSARVDEVLAKTGAGKLILTGGFAGSFIFRKLALAGLTPGFSVIPRSIFLFALEYSEHSIPLYLHRLSYSPPNATLAVVSGMLERDYYKRWADFMRYKRM